MYDKDGKAKKARPVFRWSEPRRTHGGKTTTVVTATEAVDLLGFNVMELYSDPLYHNVGHVEKCLQKRYCDLPLGYGRLWRKEMGHPCKDKKGDVKVSYAY